MICRPVAFLGLLQQLQAVEFHALEIVGRSARLEGAAAQDLGAGRGHRFGGLHDLLLGLHRARARHDDELVAADFDAVDAHLRALLLEFLADELVGRGDPHRPFDSGRGFERFETGGHVAPTPTTPITTRSSPSIEWTLKSEFANALADMVDFRLWGHEAASR